MHESEKWKWSHSVVSDSSRPNGPQPTRLLQPWDFPGKSTGVGCHCLLPLLALESPINMRIFTWSPIRNKVVFFRPKGLKPQLDHLPRCPTPPLPNTHKEIHRHTKQGLKITASKWWMNCTIVGSPPRISSKRDKDRTTESLRSQSALRASRTKQPSVVTVSRSEGKGDHPSGQDLTLLVSMPMLSEFQTHSLECSGRTEKQCFLHDPLALAYVRKTHHRAILMFCAH